MNKNYFDGLYFAMPINTNKYHIFKDGRSFCGKWMMFGKNPDLCTDVEGNETLGRDDCKACYKKAKIISEKEKEGLIKSE